MLAALVANKRIHYRVPSGHGKLEKIGAFDWSGTVREKWEVREK